MCVLGFLSLFGSSGSRIRIQVTSSSNCYCRVVFHIYCVLAPSYILTEVYIGLCMLPS